MDSSQDHGGDVADSGSDMPSCLGCRRRKLKCSRQQPECSHCQRLGSQCEYDLKKLKPGIKAGAVSSLSRRIEALEQVVLQGHPRPIPVESSDTAASEHRHACQSSNSLDVVEVLSMLTKELQKLTSKPQQPPPSVMVQAQQGPMDAFGGYATASPTMSHWSRHTFDGHDGAASHRGSIGTASGRPRKRRRVDSCGNPNVELSLPLGESLSLEDCNNDGEGSTASSLPAPELLEDVIDAYFDSVQPWIPILHETRFRWRIHNRDRFPGLVVILHAMVYAALRFVDDTGVDSESTVDVGEPRRSRLDSHEVERLIIRSRRAVILTSMNTLSVENLQALTIIAFTDIGNGQASQAWSIVGSLTRTVEYLQLSVEDDDGGEQPLLRPLPILSNPRDWTEKEERRRVFWNIFCLDRFCSVTTGWNTSLTSDNVRRRLPADGGLWHNEEGVTTAYFGIWDKSVAKIGNSIAFLPGRYPSPSQNQDSPATVGHASSATRPTPRRPAPPGGSGGGPDGVDMTTIGAFAYRVEATESLSRITTYFLQQKVDFQDKQQVGDWLTRFKELDLRLVHWKMFLPQRWRDSNISRQADCVNMDPNLTLAHVTHNTSMILLHQRIAYPGAGGWFRGPQPGLGLRLPSACSAETCHAAAVETTTITQKYLRHTSSRSIVDSQYAFCVFISARVLLIHWRHYKTDLALEFWALVDALDEMTARWTGLGRLRSPAFPTGPPSLARNYAKQLRILHARCEADPYFELEVLEYTGAGGAQGPEHIPSSFSSPTGLPQHHGNDYTASAYVAGNQSHGQIPQPLGPTLIHGEPHVDKFVSPQGVDVTLAGLTPGTADMHQHDRLSALSHMLMDEDFLSMDRVISLDDMIFAAPEGNANGMA